MNLLSRVMKRLFWLRAFSLAAFLCLSLPAWSCSTGACVSAGPRLASIDSTRGALLNALLGNLLGGSLGMTVVDWNAIAQGNVNLLSFLNALQASTNVSSPSQALSANATVAQLVAAMKVAAQADANVSLSNALTNLISQLPNTGSTVRVGDLLKVTVPSNALSSVKMNALDLLAGQIQLYNKTNVLTTPTPVSISGSAIGLNGTLNTVALSAQVIEAPIYICGPTGTQFHSAAIRVKLKIDLVQLTPGVGLLTVLPGVLGASVKVVNLDLYAEIARGDGILGTINAISQSVNVQATPGIASLYLGKIDNAVFFNRTHTLNVAADLDYGTIGSVTINGSTVAIDIKSYANGDAPFSGSATFNGPFPQTQTISTSVSFVANLVSSLTSNLSIRVTPSLGLLDAVVLPVLKIIVNGAVTPVLSTLLNSLAEPLLQTLGIGLGELVMTVDGIGQVCSVSGVVYNDVNKNNGYDSGEPGVKLTMYAKLILGGTVSQTVTVDPNSGVYSFPYVPTGTYSLIVDIGNGTGITPVGPGGWVATETPTMTRSITISAADFAGQNFGFFGGNTSFALVKTVNRTTAKPGDTLIYTLTFTNSGTTSISGIKISDATPTYTVFTSAACGAQPTGITGCAVSAQPAANAYGALEWTLTGTLLPGASGNVSFNVIVN